MKILAFTSIVVLGLSAGCGDDDDGGATDAGADGGADATTVETGVVTGTVRTAQLAGEPTAAAGVAIVVEGTDDPIITDAQGFYSLEAPVGLTRLLATKAEHWGAIYTLEHTTAVSAENDFEVVPNTVVATVDGLIEDSIDPAKGIVLINFATANEGGGEIANVPGAQGSFTFDSEGAPAEGNNTQAGGDPFLLFYGVPVGAATVTVTGASGVNTCTLDHTGSWPILAATFTLVSATCTAI
jgi:hypothetical protein